jgi:hypothetical protein
MVGLVLGVTVLAEAGKPDETRLITKMLAIIIFLTGEELFFIRLSFQCVSGAVGVFSNEV